MTIIEAVAGGHKGHVRAVFSERCRGFALPLDLVRVHCRSVGRVLRMFGTDAQDEVLRALEKARVSSAFADYLVSDDEAGYPFVNRRSEHAPVFDRLAMTGAVSALAAGMVMRSQSEGDEVRLTGWHLDAPGYIAAGGMRWHHGEFDCEGFAAPMIRGRE